MRVSATHGYDREDGIGWDSVAAVLRPGASVSPRGYAAFLLVGVASDAAAVVVVVVRSTLCPSAAGVGAGCVCRSHTQVWGLRRIGHLSLMDPWSLPLSSLLKVCASESS